MEKNLLKEKILEGKPILGAFLGFNSPNLVEIFGYTGFDFIILDREHGSMSISESENMIRAAETAGIVPIIRVPSNERTNILKALDIGSFGVQIPMVNTKEDAEKAVSFAKYSAKMNSRGLTFSTRAASYGVGVNKDLHMQTSNDESLVIVQIETQDAINNLDGILEVDGVDFVFIGPSDLSQSLNLPGQVNHPLVQKTMEEAIGKIVAANKVPGLFIGDPKEAKKWIDLGVKYIACGGPALISGGMKNFVSTFLEQLQ